MRPVRERGADARPRGTRGDLLTPYLNLGIPALVAKTPRIGAAEEGSLRPAGDAYFVRPPLDTAHELAQDPAEPNILNPSPSEPDEHDHKHYHGKRDY